MGIKTHITQVSKGQDLTFRGTIVDDDGVIITDNISSWTFYFQIASKGPNLSYPWTGATTVFSSTSATIDNTAKTVSFAIAKADTDDFTSATYLWQIRRTGSGTEKALGDGTIEITGPNPAP